MFGLRSLVQLDALHAEESLLAAVAASGSLRDRTIVTVMLHTGLRAREVCTVHRNHITKMERSDFDWLALFQS